WRMDIHHATHVHAASFVADGPAASFVAQNHGDGAGVFDRLHMTVTDTGGLKDSSFVDIFPEIDLEPSAVTVSPASPAAGATASFAFKIYNRGRMPAPLSRWRLVAGNALIAERDTLVGPLDSLSLVVSAAVPPAPGTYGLRIAVD